MERTLGKRVQVIPNSGGGLPNDVFMDHLGVQLLWVPHSYNPVRHAMGSTCCRLAADV